MKRLRHVAFRAQQREGEHIREDEPPSLPIYDTIAEALRYWDILGLAKYDGLAYEDTVVRLPQHLFQAHDVHGVEHLVLQAFAEPQGSSQCDPEVVLRMHALAADIFACWSQYLQRHEQSTVSPSYSRAWGLMGRHYYPRTNNR